MFKSATRQRRATQRHFSTYPQSRGETYLAQSREAEHAASTSDRLMVRPDEFQEMPRAMSAHQTWVDWHQDNLSGHDGLIRADHPLLLRALDRLQSASSLVKLLRDPWDICGRMDLDGGNRRSRMNRLPSTRSSSAT